MTETFAQARARIMGELGHDGWDVHTHSKHTGQPLKTPYAISPSGAARLWFKPQALYVSAGKAQLKDADSLVSDYRGLASSRAAEWATWEGRPEDRWTLGSES